MAAAPSSGTNSGILRYPSRRIEASDDYLSIQIIKYQPPAFGNITADNLNIATSTELLSTETSLQTIYLPMPQGISDSSSVGWGDDSLNTAEAFGAKELSATLQKGDFGQGLTDALKNTGTALKNLSQTGAAQVTILSRIASSLVNSAGGNTTPEGILSRSTGQVLNPHMELLFKSVSLRSFNFSFEFAPRDADEAQVVKNILRAFKKNMSPKSGGQSGSPGGAPGGVFISAPNVFKLEYRTGPNKHAFLNSFKPMALQNMSINYTPSGTYATYEDTTPVHMQMTLQFQELNPIYYEDYTDSDTGVGY